MRYHRKLGMVNILTWLTFALVVTATVLRSGHSWGIADAAGIATGLLFYLPYQAWYWEIQPGEVVHRRYFQPVVFPFREISYVGPVSGAAGDCKAMREWVEIRKLNGECMTAQPARSAAFTGEMRQHLERMTGGLL